MKKDGRSLAFFSCLSRSWRNVRTYDMTAFALFSATHKKIREQTVFKSWRSATFCWEPEPRWPPAITLTAVLCTMLVAP